MEFYQEKDFCIRYSRSQQKKKCACVRRWTVIRSAVPMRKDILTESTMQSMSCGRQKTIMEEKRSHSRQRNGRYVRMNYVLILLCGWMQSFVIIIMCLILMRICRDFLEKGSRGIIFFSLMRPIIWSSGAEKCTAQSFIKRMC